MLPFEDRYTRQRQVPEIGSAGQQRIEALEATLSPGPRSVLALVYLHRAGVRRAGIDGSHAARAHDFPHAEVFRFSDPLELAASCHQALAHIRQQLDFTNAGVLPNTPPSHEKTQ